MTGRPNRNDGPAQSFGPFVWDGMIVAKRRWDIPKKSFLFGIEEEYFLIDAETKMLNCEPARRDPPSSNQRHRKPATLHDGAFVLAGC
jgi:hypothetical protein